MRGNIYRDRITWWKSKRYPANAFAECPNGKGGLRPENVSVDMVGHPLSIPVSPGLRVYSFESELFRDRFVELYAHLGARACEDPYP